MIKIKNLSKKYDDSEILTNINLEFSRGEVTFIVGDSGSGKSTLLNMIGGLDVPTEGEILLDGDNIFCDVEKYRREKVGFIFQDYNLISGMNIKNNIEVATLMAGYEPDEKIIELSKEFGIEGLGKNINLLSGGEKQRIAIIRSICKNSEIIIADEPTGNLDENNTEKIINNLVELKKDKYIIIVTHNMELAQKYGDKIIRIKAKAANIEKQNNNFTETNIIDCKQSNTDNKKVRNKRNTRKAVGMLGRNSVRNKLGRIALMILVLTITLIGVSITPFMINEGYEIQDSVNVSYLENDQISVIFGVTNNTKKGELPFEDTEIEELDKEYSINEIVPVYNSYNSIWTIEANGEISEPELKIVKCNKFFEERIFQNNIEGSFITEDNQIIIGEKESIELFGKNNSIGQKITINDGNGVTRELTIVGINHTQNAYDNYFSYISSEMAKDIAEEMLISSIVSGNVQISEYTEGNDRESVSSSFKSEIIDGSIGTISEKEKITYGKAPEKENEILLNSKYYDMMFSNEEDAKEFMSETYCISLNGIYKVRVVGFFENKSEAPDFKVSESVINEMKKTKPLRLDIYAKDKKEAEKMKNNLDDEGKYKTMYRLQELKTRVMSESEFFTKAIKIIDGIMIVLSIALIISYVKITLVERKKEIAIIKSFGAKDGTATIILLYDFVFIAIVSIILVFAATFAGTFIIKNNISSMKMLNFNGVYKYEIIVCIAYCILLISLVTLFLRKMTKKQPANLLKN